MNQKEKQPSQRKKASIGADHGRTVAPSLDIISPIPSTRIPAQRTEPIRPYAGKQPHKIRQQERASAAVLRKKRRKRTFPTLPLLCTLLLLLLFGFLGQHLWGNRSVNEVSVDPGSFTAATVQYVLDGCHVVVLEEGTQKTVRLLGLKDFSPIQEDGSTNEAATTAASALAALLPAGTHVYLQSDTTATATADRDAEGNLLRYLWLELPDATISFEDITTKMAEGLLLSAGQTEAELTLPNLLYRDYFTKLKKLK